MCCKNAATSEEEGVIFTAWDKVCDKNICLNSEHGALGGEFLGC